MNLVFLLVCIFSMEKDKTEKTVVLQKQSVFQNGSSIKLFLKTNEFSWEDPNNLVGNEIKEEIEVAFRHKGEAKSNLLFDCISDWFSAREARLFVQELLFFISESVDVDRRNTFNQTPLMLAAYFGSEKAIFKLVDRGAKIQAVDPEGNTALHWAATDKNVSCCKMLLVRGAKINAQNKCGVTPLMFAARSCSSHTLAADVEAVKLLLRWGADEKIKNNYGETALTRATQDCVAVIQGSNYKSRYTELCRCSSKLNEKF